MVKKGVRGQTTIDARKQRLETALRLLREAGEAGADVQKAKAVLSEELGVSEKKVMEYIKIHSNLGRIRLEKGIVKLPKPGKPEPGEVKA